MSGIYKTAGTTSRERWNHRALGGVYIVLYTLIIVGMVWWLVTAGLDTSFPLWVRWALIAGTGLLMSDYKRNVLVILGDYRNDWILHKARKRDA